MTSRPHGIDGWGFPNQEYAPEPHVMELKRHAAP